MEVDSPTKQEEPRRAFEKSLEEVSGDKLIDLKKTFAKKKWEKLKKKHNENPAPSLNRREIDKQPCGLYNSGNFCYVNSFLQVSLFEINYYYFIDFTCLDLVQWSGIPTMHLWLATVTRLQEWNVEDEHSRCDECNAAIICYHATYSLCESYDDLFKEQH